MPSIPDPAAVLAEFRARSENREYFAAVVMTEMRERMTALRERIRAPHANTIIGALSANGRWGYEKEGRIWVAVDKTGREGLRFGTSLRHIRQVTFEVDHPVHTVAREPRPMTFTVV
jgi:hypothetical protein